MAKARSLLPLQRFLEEACRALCLPNATALPHLLQTRLRKDTKMAARSPSRGVQASCQREVPPQVFGLLDSAGSDEKWWEAVELQKLILAHNNIEDLTEDLGKLSSLLLLNVSHNKLKTLPLSISRLITLKTLDASNNAICELPMELGEATALIASNPLTKIPEELALCTRLSILDVEGNNIKEFPATIFSSLTSLTELNAAKNGLTELPESVGCLSRLVRLNLHQNRITSVPSTIAGCCALVELSLGNNLLSSIPGDIKALTLLSTLDLSTNQLTEFPEEACSLQLTMLDLSNNSLTGLPAELGSMTSLRKLMLVGNPLRTFRSALVMGPTPALLKFLRSRLPSKEEVKTTSVAGNVFGVDVQDHIQKTARDAASTRALSFVGLALETVPSACWETPDLLSLDLSKNKISDFPLEISMCTSLETLLLADNKIKEWPSSILASLTNLRKFVFSNNPVKQLPDDAFLSFKNLRVLDISGLLAQLPPSPAFAVMPHLEELHLRRIQLQAFPEDITSLAKLKVLDLSQNAITSIPQEISGLTCLEVLDVSDNNLSNLPPQLGLLEATLQLLKVDGNPLRSIRRPILDRGSKGLLQYLKDRMPL